MAKSDNQNYSIIQRYKIVLYSFENTLLGLHLLPLTKEMFWSLRISVFSFGIFAYYKLYTSKFHYQKDHFEKYNALLMAVTSIVAMFIVYLLVTGIKFNDRYMAVAFPLFILILIVFKQFSSLIQNLIFGTISLFFIVILSQKYSNPVKTYDYPSLAQFVEMTELPNESLLFNSRTISLPFEYYYEGVNAVVPLPSYCKLSENAFQKLIKDTIQLKQLITESQIGSPSILFINDNLNGYSHEFKFSEADLDEYLNTNYKITLDTLFFGNSQSSSIRIRRLLTEKK
jgi:membrane-associated HD superfamily phosphohydrolase